METFFESEVSGGRKNVSNEKILVWFSVRFGLVGGLGM
jgi:hypothetical protein